MSYLIIYHAINLSKLLIINDLSSLKCQVTNNISNLRASNDKKSAESSLGYWLGLFWDIIKNKVIQSR